jgi:hypothetical protein
MCPSCSRVKRGVVCGRRAMRVVRVRYAARQVTKETESLLFAPAKKRLSPPNQQTVTKIGPWCYTVSVPIEIIIIRGRTPLDAPLMLIYYIVSCHVNEIHYTIVPLHNLPGCNNRFSACVRACGACFSNVYSTGNA